MASSVQVLCRPQLDPLVLEALDTPLCFNAVLRAVYTKAMATLPRPHLQHDIDLYAGSGLAVRPAPANSDISSSFASTRLPPNGDLYLNPTLCGPARDPAILDPSRRFSYTKRPGSQRADPARPGESRQAREYTSWLKWLARIFLFFYFFSFF
jgi:hypothetical protein